MVFGDLEKCGAGVSEEEQAVGLECQAPSTLQKDYLAGGDWLRRGGGWEAAKLAACPDGQENNEEVPSPRRSGA